MPAPDRFSHGVYLAVVASWFAFVVLFGFYKKPSKGTNRRRDPVSTLGLLLQMICYFLVWWFPRPSHSPLIAMPKAAEIALGIAAVGIAFGSVWFCLEAIRALGKQWALVAQVMEGHELVAHGPYAIVRNPIYLAMFGMAVATGLAVSRWQALVAGVIVFLVGTEIRIRAEEKLLRGAFGEKFDEYARRVPGFLPRIY
jgi:protein-S-isoprenylcysteine O-methyltransferase Ste14